MSTAGLQAPSVKGVGEDRYLEDFPALFVFFFSMTGVPIFGLALGQLGGLLVDHHIAAKERESMAKLLTKDEFDSVSGLDYGAGDEGAQLVSFAEFALLEMLRLGKTNVEQMKHIKEEFQRRDEDGSGDLTWEEIRLFQVSRAARSMEVQLLMRRDGLSIKDANNAVFGNKGKGIGEFTPIAIPCDALPDSSVLGIHVGLWLGRIVAFRGDRDLEFRKVHNADGLEAPLRPPPLQCSSA